MTKIKDFQTARDTARRVKKAELDPLRVVYVGPAKLPTLKAPVSPTAPAEIMKAQKIKKTKKNK